jgi:hypothetical protein
VLVANESTWRVDFAGGDGDVPAADVAEVGMTEALVVPAG